ncbi:MAG TPA: sensor histidine kinase [Candidatus Udaeobacter sp.]|nr:sensor histidine kinase [Candidatus Udaeobacter sp.]
MQPIKKFWKIRTYFLLGVFIITLITTGLFIFIRGQEVVADEKRLIAERDKIFVHTLAGSISVYVNINTENVERLAGLINKDNFSADKLYPLAENTIKNSNGFFAIIIADKNGDVVSGYNKLASNENDRLVSGINISDRQYFKELIATRKIVVSDAITARVPPYVPTIAIAVPIFGDNKEIIGAAVGGLTLEPLYHLAEAALGSEFATPVVFDKQGQVIVHVNSDLIKEHKLFKDFEPAKRALRGEEGFLDAFIDVDGKERSAAYARVPELGWGVWIAQDTAQFYQIKQHVAFVGLIWETEVLFGVFLVFLFLSRLLFRPFDYLATEAIDIVESNDFNRKIGIVGPMHSSEIVNLTNNFNLLIEKVRSSFDAQSEIIKTKSQFLTVTTHAFRTPLTVLQWTLASIMEKFSSFSAEQKTGILELYDATQRLVLGFENLFTALEIQEKTARLGYKKINIVSIIKSVIKKLEPLAEKSKISINFSSPGIVMLAGDEIKIQRLIEILCSNAIFYNREGGSINIELTQDKNSILLKITDSGIGIPADEFGSLFQPFFRGKKAVLKYTDGAGLGLFIAKAFIELHHGLIDINSQKSKGTIVTVQLPLHLTLDQKKADKDLQ